MPTKVINIKAAPANWRSDSRYVYIGRGSIWGNPYAFTDGTLAAYKVANRAEAIAAYKAYITTGAGQHLLEQLHTLRGKILICYCCPQACHGDTLVEFCDGGAARLVQESLF